MGENLLVHLRVFRGAINYDAQGKVKSDNQIMKVRYGVHEWINTMETAKYHFSQVTVDKVEEITTTYEATEHRDKSGNIIQRKIDKYKQVAISDQIKADVATCLNAPEKELTPEQKTIAEMRKELDALKNQGSSDKDESQDDTPEINEELEAAQSRWEQLKGKRPNQLIGLKRLNKEIAEMEAAAE